MKKQKKAEFCFKQILKRKLEENIEKDSRIVIMVMIEQNTIREHIVTVMKEKKQKKEKNNLFYLTFVLPSFFYYYLIVCLKFQKNSNFLYY